MNKSNFPWDLSRVPNYNSAGSLEEVKASQISEKEFRNEFIVPNKPLLLKGACESWRAMEKWSSPKYFDDVCGSESVNVRRTPRIEYRVNPSLQSLYDENDKTDKMLMSEFLREATARECGALWLQSYQLKNDFSQHRRISSPFAAYKLRNRHSPFLKLADDVGKFDFVSEHNSTRAYPSRRAFIGRNSYTDWHGHPVDEALMCQITGSKEVLLAAPDDTSWNAIFPVALQKGHTFDVDINKFPAFAKLKLYRVVVHPGDALFIPIYWWHAVQSLNDKLGITVACTFRSAWSAMFDLRYPNVRFSLRKSTSVKYFPLIPVGVMCSLFGRTARSLSSRG